MPIYFYVPKDEHGYLSNFAPYGIDVDGKWYPTVEHFFQASKFPGHTLAERIRTCSTPKEAKRLGWSRDAPLRQDWETVRDEIMLLGLKVKFRTHSEIRARLAATGAEELVENAPGDYYWGCGADGSGKNRLGRLLMQVRQELTPSASS